MSAVTLMAGSDRNGRAETSKLTRAEKRGGRKRQITSTQSKSLAIRYGRSELDDEKREEKQRSHHKDNRKRRRRRDFTPSESQGMLSSMATRE